MIDNFVYLKGNILLSGSGLLELLLQARVLDQRELAEINFEGADHKQIDTLLKMILRTSQEQYQLFLELLKKAGHEHVYLKLIGIIC